MAPQPKGPTAHDTSTSPSYPMGPFSTGGSSYTNTVPEDLDESQGLTRDLPTAVYPSPSEAPPMYAPPNRHPRGHGPGPYGSQQHLVQDAPAHPPPAYSKYTTAAQARWARSSRIAKFLCIGILIAIVVIIVAVAAGVTLTRGGNSGPGSGTGNGNGNGFPGPGSGGSGNCASYSDFGANCTSGSDCQSGICRLNGFCGC